MISITFIINPISGGHNKRKVEKIIDKYFKDDKYFCKKIYTSFPNHAYNIARIEQGNGTDIIAAVGGDGTINEISRALMFTQSKLAIIPVGSGNGFARHFKIPLKITDAVKRILSENEIKIDIGFVNKTPFFCTSGIGFDAETGKTYNKFDTRGFLSYAFSFMLVFRNYVAKKYLIITDDEKIEVEAFFINIANISQYGYNFVIAPGASAIDGTLDMIIIRKFPKWKGLILAFYLIFGKIDKCNYVIRKKVKSVTIKTFETNNIIHIDGEPKVIQKNEFNYEVKQKGLRVII